MDVALNKFRPREYQKEAYSAIMHEGYKRVLLVSPRRSGKDLLAWNLAIFHALKKTCMVFYALPCYAQARKCIWDAIGGNGQTFLSYIPKEAIANINQSEMKIRLKNESIIQCIGADSYNTSLVGTNPSFLVFSEFALCDPAAYKFAMPILAENGGTLLLVSTPRGHNALYDLYHQNKNNPDWKVILQTVEDTKHISPEALAAEKKQMPESLFEQEFFCSFDRGCLEGSIYGRCINEARSEGRICDVPWNKNLLVYCSMDLGFRDDTTIVWYQSINNGNTIHVIDCYSNHGQGLEFYANHIKSKPYTLGGIFCPHDMAVHEFGGGGISRYERAHELGLEVQILPQSPLQEGIDLVYTTFNRIYIDQTKCRSLIDALENYKRSWDEQRQVFSLKPVHNYASHYADAFRLMVQSLPRAKKGMTGDEITRLRQQMMSGQTIDVPPIFRGDTPYDRFFR